MFLVSKVFSHYWPWIFGLAAVVTTYALIQYEGFQTSREGYTNAKIIQQSHASVEDVNRNATVGIMIPLYVDSDSDAWDKLIEIKQMHPHVVMIAIVNLDHGPGSFINQSYLTRIQDLKSSGIDVLGYTYTDYGRRSIISVQDDIDAWKRYDVDGISLDEMSNIAGDESYYHNLSSYAKSKGLTFTVGNPGTHTLESYIGIVDTMTIYEGQGVPALELLKNRTFGGKYDNRNFNFVAYGVQTLDQEYIDNAIKYVGYFYLTNDNLPNPWNSLPPYIDELVSYVAKYNQ